MSWQPDQLLVSQLTHILEGTLSSNYEIRTQAQQLLEQARSTPDLNNYLLFILVDSTNFKPEIRASSGLFLKNNLNKDRMIDPNLLNWILKGLKDGNLLVRNITGTVISSIFHILGVENWPNLLEELMKLIELENDQSLMSTLLKICEDSCYQLANSELNPLSSLIPGLVNLLTLANPKIRLSLILCLNQFFKTMSQALLVNLDQLLNKLFMLCQDDHDKLVRKNLSTIFALFLETRPDKLLPHLDGILDYTLHCMNDEDEEVALELCEFLLALSSSEIDKIYLSSKLEIILETLLTKMVFSDLEIMVIEELDSRNDEVEDKDTDIKPVIVKSNVHTQSKKSNENQESDDDDTEEDEDDELSDWNLRKCSLATLDVFASLIPDQVVSIVLPKLKPRLIDQYWPVRELGILLFGAILEGCLEVPQPDLPELIRFLNDRLSDKEPRVRQITCWTLSRYSTWICEQHGFFESVFNNLMNCALDPKKIVQELGCSSISSFIENSDIDVILSIVEPILQFFHSCFQRYKRKNLIILYDSIQTFVEKIGDYLNTNSNFINLLLPPLIEKWQLLKDDDKDLWPLLECMSSVALAMGENFAPFAVDVYTRAIKILSNCIEQESMGIIAAEKDFMVTSLDLIDGLVQGLKGHILELILEVDKSIKFSFIQLLLSCFEDPVDDVRQSSFALLGDLAIFTGDQIIAPYLQLIFLTIGNEITNKNFNSLAVVNNAVWSFGEISLKISRDQMAPYLPNLIPILIDLLQSTDVESTVLENTLITMGRLGLQSPEMMSERVEEWLLIWTSYMKYLDENDEKRTSYLGMLQILLVKPVTLSNVTVQRALGKFIEGIGSYENPGEELLIKFQGFLSHYEKFCGSKQSFDTTILKYVDQDERGFLNLHYGL